jgi:hypothetical protein
MGLGDMERKYGIVCRETAMNATITPEALQDILAQELIVVSLSEARNLLGEVETIYLFKRLIIHFAATNNNLRATVEDLQELLEQQHLTFSVNNIKKYGHLSLIMMIREVRNT